MGIKTAEILFRESIWNQVCFHSQQAVEKLLKSAIPPEIRPRSHKIADLIGISKFSFSKDLKKSMLRLDRFYIPTRYPDALPGSLEDELPSPSDADEALKTAMTLRVSFEFNM